MNTTFDLSDCFTEEPTGGRTLTRVWPGMATHPQDREASGNLVLVLANAYLEALRSREWSRDSTVVGVRSNTAVNVASKECRYETHDLSESFSNLAGVIYHWYAAHLHRSPSPSKWLDLWQGEYTGQTSPIVSLPDLEQQTDEIEIDYTEMDRRSKFEIPIGVNWLSALSESKSYQELFDFQYDLSNEESR